MKRLPVHLSPEAAEDLADIRGYYLREVSAAASTRIVSRIRKKLVNISQMPKSGVPRPEIGENVRLFVSGSYVIYADVGADDVAILRILHAAQDRDTIMRNRD